VITSTIFKKNYKQIYFSGISFNSNQIKKNNIFFAIKGNKIDGNSFISSAISNGAKIIVTEKKINRLKKWYFIYSIKNIRKLLAEISFKIIKKFQIILLLLLVQTENHLLQIFIIKF
jgi:murE/murF fusion protein